MTNFLGRQLGNYRLIRLLGQGGFAEVYQGQHTHLDTWAAIKVLRAELYTDEDRNEFRKEARTIANLQHPNIVRVLDFGIENGIPFLVLEYAPNGTMLNRHARGSKVPFQYIISYSKQITSALQYAHDRKIVHRDVKPANILLGPGGDILLSDFGLAFIAESMTAGWGSNDSAKDAAGTVAYMAPEQLRGKPSAKSDQYSLAIMVYEWLTGELPFRGAYLEVATMQAQMPPPPLREKEPSIPADVEYVVLKALSKDPQERFNSVQAFATALEQAFSAHVVNQEPSKNQGELTFEKTKQWKPPVQAYLYGPSGRVELTGEFTIGRRPDNNLVITDPLASGYHAKILPIETGYGIKDMGSANKTILNEKDWLESGRSQALKPGDVIRLGSTKLIYEEESPGGASVVSQGQTMLNTQMNAGNFAPPLSPPPPPPQASLFSAGTLPPAQNSWYGNSAPPSFQPNPPMPPPQSYRPSKGRNNTAKLLIGLIVVLVIISSVAFFALKKGPGPTGPGRSASPTVARPSPSPSPPVQTATWNVILNGSISSLTYGNYQVTDSVSTHYIVYNLSFANNTSQTQSLNGSLLDLRDSTGTHYTEALATNPQQTVYVNSGQSVQLYAAFVVPDSQCQYTLVFTDPTGAASSWDTTVTGSYCTG